MGIFGNTSKKPRVVPKVVKETKVSFFGDKGHLSREKFRGKLRSDSGKIPGSHRCYTKRERTDIEKEFGYKEAGTYIDERDYKYRIKNLEKEKYRAKTGQEKQDLGRKISYLKKLKDS